jgi:hypothetical protein
MKQHLDEVKQDASDTTAREREGNRPGEEHREETLQENGQDFVQQDATKAIAMELKKNIPATIEQTAVNEIDVRQLIKNATNASNSEIDVPGLIGTGDERS